MHQTKLNYVLQQQNLISWNESTKVQQNSTLYVAMLCPKILSSCRKWWVKACRLDAKDGKHLETKTKSVDAIVKW